MPYELGLQLGLFWENEHLTDRINKCAWLSPKSC
jgi:hypothetical protein